MGHDNGDRRKQTIETVVARARTVLESASRPAAETFIGLFFQDVPPVDLSEMDDDALYGAALGLWEFAQRRHSGVPAIRLYNPNYDEQGWHTRHTVIEIVNDDMPFLVDSLTSALAADRITVHLVIHPVARVSRDVDGVLQSITPADPDSGSRDAESLMHLQIDEVTDPAKLQAVQDRLLAVLKDVRAAVADYPAMKKKVQAEIEGLTADRLPVSADTVAETAALLAWMADDHFTFLGYREYTFENTGDGLDLKIDRKSGLGVLRDTAVSIFNRKRDYAQLPESIQSFMREPVLLTVTKSNRHSTVHRSVHMDSIILKTFDEDGNVTGERIFVGLFTSSTYSEPVRTIPYLRRKTRSILERSGFDPAGHNGKALQNILDTFPRDELFQIDEPTLMSTALGILHLQERQRTALFVRYDTYGRYASCLIYVPRDRYNTQMRGIFQQILEAAFNGTAAANPNVLMTEGVHARVHMIIRLDTAPPAGLDLTALEAELERATRGWPDRFMETLIEAKGEERGIGLFRIWGEAFPTVYRERIPPGAALGDLGRIVEVAETGSIGLNLYHTIGAKPYEVGFKLYHQGAPVPLSDVLPVLEHFGFRVISEEPYRIRPAGDRPPIWMHDFTMESRDRASLDVAQIKPVVQEAFTAVWTGAMEDDGFNALIAAAGLTWRQVAIVRAYSRYLKQVNLPWSQSLQEETLARYPAISRALLDLFNARFDPASRDEERETRMAGARVALDHGLEDVESLAEDRIVRRYWNAIEATLRTNAFQTDADGEPKPWLSFKFDSTALEDLPAPRPWREIFVYSPQVEGVHLRTGPVARGGLRWSDRREDFRTEVLDLVKAQKVKNAVIVPVGSKGGFVVKRPPVGGDRAAQQEAGIACYRTFIRGLLDLTDNRDGEEIRHPADTVRHDPDDPYLVVAADKGTATFSDIANEISAEYGFWLGDAFASGGSAGYDHKKMGITAKGAWESVKRHFRELGHDTQTQPFTAAGVGDMSGDVFGNGMLLSDRIRLQAAFNHRHIFIDPDPDCATGFAERKRLFDIGRGSWDTYDASLISKGGGVFDRNARSIPLTPEIKRLLDLTQDRLTPNELIVAILKMRVDLLWFGGIGTYIKAREETHAAVGDKANDALRIDGRHVRARVIGEGANLALTQLGRVEYARQGGDHDSGSGGHLNADFIDNSAGVDCSDHEVNIKILLDAVVRSGDMTGKQRNALLSEMTDEVSRLVLRDNYLQTESLSVTMTDASDLFDQQCRFIRRLEKEGRFERSVENLPSDEEMTERAAQRSGLTRPELSVVFSYAKIDLYDSLIESDLPDDPTLAEDLYGYFPEQVQKTYKPIVDGHRLRREIIATVATNSLVNRAGPTFMAEMTDKTGMGPADVTRAFIIVRDTFDLRRLWGEIESLDGRVSARQQIHLLKLIRHLVERGTAWLLRNGTAKPGGVPGERLPIGQTVEHYKPGISLLIERANDILHSNAQAVLDDRVAGMEAEGVPTELARRTSSLNVQMAGFDLVRISDTTGQDLLRIGPVYFELGFRLGLSWLREQAQQMRAASHWQKQAVEAATEDLYALQADITINLLSTVEGVAELEAETLLHRWIEGRKAPIERIDLLLNELRAMDNLDVSMLAVANRRLRGLIAG